MESLEHREYREATPPIAEATDDNDNDNDDEASRLLSQPPPRTESPTDSASLQREGGSHRDEFASPLSSYTVVFIFALVLIAGFGSSLLSTPEVRLMEMALCRDYYRTSDPSVIGPPPLSYVDEERCKLDNIQVELAYIMATKSLLSAIPGK